MLSVLHLWPSTVISPSLENLFLLLYSYSISYCRSTFGKWKPLSNTWILIWKCHDLSSSIKLNIAIHNWFHRFCCCSVAQSCPTLSNPIYYSMPGFPVLHHLLEFAQTHVHWVGDAIQPSHPLSFPSPALNLSQHQGHFQWIGSWHQVAKVLEFQLQHQCFQWIFRVDFL